MKNSVICFVCSKGLVFGRFGHAPGIVTRKGESRKIAPGR